MKSLIKKMLILILIITFIVPRVSYAADTTAETGTSSTGKNSKGYKSYTNLYESGTADVKGRQESVNETFTLGDAVSTVFAFLFTGIAESGRLLVTMVVQEGNKVPDQKFTIASLISGKYPILNNNFLTAPNEGSSTNNSIKSQVGGWYYAIRNLAIILSLLMLLYVGIRMILSTIADDKAKYKKMLYGWIQSFILIFVLHYIMTIAFVLQKALIDIINKLGTIDGNVEQKILGDSLVTICKANGWNILWGAMLYWIIASYQLKFFMLYAKRMIATAFLTIIAPLVTVTYSIDKVGDNRAQAYNAWFKEFLVNVFIQPLHLLVYLVFIVSASEIATTVPLFTVIFFAALTRGEKIIKGVLGMRGMKSINSIEVKKGKR